MKRYPYQPESMAKLNRLYELSDYPAIEAVIRPRPEPWPSGWAAVCYDDELA